MADMTEKQADAIERLLVQALHHETGQARRVADFLLAWWNPEHCGRFDLTDLWGCDDAIAEDMVTVFAFIAHNRQYPDTLGYEKQYAQLVRQWRPEVA